MKLLSALFDTALLPIEVVKDILCPWPMIEGDESFTKLAKDVEGTREGKMPDKLKPCPFCGADDPVEKTELAWPSWCDTGDGDWYYVQCRNCESATGGYHKIREEAITAWNCRVKASEEKPGESK